MSRVATLRGVVLTLVVGLAGVVIANWIHVPAGTLIGAMVAAAVANLLWKPMVGPPEWMRQAARVVLGMMIGMSITPETLHAVAGALLPVSIMVVALMVLATAVAWGLYRWGHLDLPTALCGASPGNLSAIVTVAQELGGDPVAVATLHLVRMVSVVLFVPAFVRLAFSGAPVAAASAVASVAGVAVDPLILFAQLALLLAAGLVLVTLLIRLGVRIPAADLLLGMALTALTNSTWLHVAQLPVAWRIAAQLIIGVGVGTTVTREAVRNFKPFARAGAVMTVFLILSGLALGWFLSLVSNVDLVTCIVGCAPGGADTMIIMASDLGADVQLVAAMHVARMVLLMVLLPSTVRAVSLGWRPFRSRRKREDERPAISS
jgi:membrane AbrB-like protein